MTFAAFPKDKLHPRQATLAAGSDGTASLAVDFAPFDFALPDGSGEVETFDKPLRADFITLPTLDLAGLAGQTFAFPANPQPGYIDASVYLLWCHTPVDITKLSFGNLADGALSLTLATRWIMIFQATGFDDFSLTFEVPVRGFKP